jgi:transcriptional regulator with XRE-family HTH domain
MAAVTAPPHSANGVPDPAAARAIRERAGWARRRMAEALGVTENTIVRWEAGTGTPAGRNLIPYIRLLDQLSADEAG